MPLINADTLLTDIYKALNGKHYNTHGMQIQNNELVRLWTVTLKVHTIL